MDAAPCADCGTTGGQIRKDCHRPLRLNGKPFGFQGTLCRACHDRNQNPRAVVPKKKRLEGARFDLAASNLEIAETSARYWDAQCHRHSGEFLSAAYWGLVVAALNYPESAPKDEFPYFAMKRIKGECIELIANATRGQSRLGDPCQLEAIASDEGQPGWAMESLDEVEGITQDLPRMAREVTRLRYCYGLQNAEIADRLDLNVSQVDYHYDRALLKLRGKGAA